MADISGTVPDAAEVRAELERVLSSRVFAQAARSRAFLRYVTEQSLKGVGGSVKEFAVADEVFGRGATYDPATDATVRVEAGRLRSRLRDYYLGEGGGNPVRIEIPRGSYEARFSWAAVSVAIAAAAGDAAAVPLDVVATSDSEAIHTPPAPGLSIQASRRSMAWIAIVIVVASAICWVAWHRARSSRAAASSAGVTLLVLPLQDKTGDSARAYLGAGLSQSLARALANISGLHVGSEQAAAQYAPIFARGGTVPFAYVLSGSVETEDQSPVFDVQLSATRDGNILMSRRYWNSAVGPAEAEAEITRDVTAALTGQPGVASQGNTLHPLTANAGAYQAYLQGEAAAQANSPAALHAAVAGFEQAVKLDPGFARAWADLSESHALLGLYYERPRDHMPAAREAAAKALKLDSALSEAHGTLGVVDLMYDRDLAAARRELSSEVGRERAFAVLSCSSHLLDQTGQSAEAEQLVRRMLVYEPRSASLVSELGCIRYYRGDNAAARKYYEESSGLAPSSPIPYWGLAKVLSGEGHYAEAVSTIDRFPGGDGALPPMLIAEKGYALAREKNVAGARAAISTLESLSTKQYVDPYFVAVIYLGLRDDATALAWLGKAEQERSPFFVSIQSEPKWDVLRNDPAFRGLAAQVFSGS